MVAKAHGAERAFVAAVEGIGIGAEAWGVDLDGLPLAEPRARLAADLVRAAIGREGAIYQRDVTTAGGRGARLAVAAKDGAAGARAMVVLEHRFAPGAFDRVTAGEAARWATLAALLLRIDGSRSNDHAAPVSAAPADAPPGLTPPALTTAFPLSAPRRSVPGCSGGARRSAARWRGSKPRRPAICRCSWPVRRAPARRSSRALPRHRAAMPARGRSSR